MKWMIASDIHGSAYWCRRLLTRFAAEGADRLLLLGDILYHGPRNDLPQDYAPREVIAMLNGMADRVFSVRGNCDTEVDQMVLAFPVLADYALLSDASLGDRLIYATHGHVYNWEHLPPMRPGDILLHGHTHVPLCRQEAPICLNPGSVSLPKEGSHHGYLTLQGGVFRFMTMEGEMWREYAPR